ncbi:MAG: hypothetical protein HFI40_04030 [Lachnospiraceae bacterium]|jgi:hypothetical protein|nr:hypothetical protein [Lachnospiraceae bacterium]MCX4315080.1 hypothetical protein [Lachnospiraceae bacterium]
MKKKLFSIGTALAVTLLLTPLVIPQPKKPCCANYPNCFCEKGIEPQDDTPPKKIKT